MKYAKRKCDDNTDEDMRPELLRTGEAITPACRQTGMTE